MAQTDFDFGRYPIEGADISVKNTSGAAQNLVGQAGGLLMKLDTANLIGSGTTVNTGIGVIPTVAVADFPFGFAIEDVPSGGTFRVQIEGIAIGVAYAAIAALAIVGASAVTAGYLIAYTAANPSIGQTCNQPATNGDPCLVRIAPSKNA